MWKKLALGLAALVAVLAAVVALQPSDFVIERSLRIEAPAPVVYAQIADLRAMGAWLPFGTRSDPQIRNRYAGPASGVGASVSWDGPRAGKGTTTITAVKPDREVEMRVEMLEPMHATNLAHFTLEPEGGATTVTWRFEGRHGFVGKAFTLFADMDGMVGGAFEDGLASLASLVEAEAPRVSQNR
jgi:uncharacterized protein YndB with AHSA1/START domain